MTTMIEDVTAALAALAPAGKVWYGVNTDEPPVFPFIVWTRISSSTNVTLDGPTDMQNTRIQIDIFATQISQAVAIENALEAAMQGAPFINVPISSMDKFEFAVRAFRVTKEYSVWSTN